MGSQSYSGLILTKILHKQKNILEELLKKMIFLLFYHGRKIIINQIRGFFLIESSKRKYVTAMVIFIWSMCTSQRFNDRFRYTDIICDISFLLMDLEYHGAYEFSKKLWQFYNESGIESGIESLVTFYKVYRAYVRGKVNSFQLDDDHIDEEKKGEATEISKKYFELARSYIG